MLRLRYDVFGAQYSIITSVELEDALDFLTDFRAEHSPQALAGVWHRLPPFIRRVAHLEAILRQEGKAYLLHTVTRAEIIRMDDCKKVSVSVYDGMGTRVTLLASYDPAFSAGGFYESVPACTVPGL